MNTEKSSSVRLRVCPICKHEGYRSSDKCIKCRPKRSPRPKRTKCKRCGKDGQRKGGLCRECAGMSLADYRGHVCKCGQAKDFASPLCLSCYSAKSGVHIWSDEQIIFLTENYPVYGAEWCSQKLSIPHAKVRDKANRLKLVLTPEATRDIVHEKAAKHMRDKNPSQAPGASDRLREQTLRMWEERPDIVEKFFEGHRNIQKSKPTKLEESLFGFLDKLGVVYEPYFMVKPKFVVDAKVGSLIIQADGDWWHGHPRFEPLKERQIKQKARDKAQDAYLTSCGYTVVRIWESDMRFDVVRNILLANKIIVGS